ncbi:MAG: asparaginase [Shimia sp.]
MPAVPMVEVWRGEVLESLHLGHAVVCDAGGVVEAWGDVEAPMLPRSACKMLQALPLVTSGAARAARLEAPQLALACASHSGADRHRARVSAWLAALGLSDADLLCGAHVPFDTEERDRLVRDGAAPCQAHNNCSGKHAGFLTWGRHVGAGPDYVDRAHPLQAAIRDVFEEETGVPVTTSAIDGCSAPNPATTLAGLGRAMARFATAHDRHDSSASAQVALREAMAAHPDLVAGEGRACTELMRAAGAGTALKTGAEGVYTAILPGKGLGIAVKAADGATRAAEAAIAALLVRHGPLDPAHPAALKRLGGPIRNWRGIATGTIRAAPGFA